MQLTRELFRAFLVQAFSVLARLALTSFGTLLIQKGLISDNQWSATLIGVATVLATIVWSILEKYNVFKYLGLAMASEKQDTLEDLKK